MKLLQIILEFLNKLWLFVINNKKTFVLSAFLTCVLMLLSYFWNNFPVFTGEKIPELFITENLKSSEEYKTFYDDSVVFFNVSHDKDLVDVYENQRSKIVIGNCAITDRLKLYSLLKGLDGSNYRYIFLDVSFYNNTVPKSGDRELFELIKGMKRIVIAYDKNWKDDLGLADSLNLFKKAGVVNYMTTVFDTKFKRLRLIQDGFATMPLKAYRECDAKDITRHDWFYTSCNHLCQNSIFVDFPSSIDGKSCIDYYRDKKIDLGLFLEEHKEDLNQSLKEQCARKYVIISDMEGDTHNTYVGKQPGSLLMFNAYHQIKKGYHIITPYYMIFFAVLYFVIILIILKRVNLLYRIPIVRDSKSKLMHVVTDMIGYGLVFVIVSVVSHIFFDRAISFLPAVVFFTIIKFIIRLRSLKNA